MPVMTQLFGLSEQTTGGKTPMSIGAFMAAEERGATSLYVTAPQGDDGLNTTKARILAISIPSLR